MNLVNTMRKIYTANDFAKNNLLYLQEIGTSQTLVPHVSKHPHLKSFLFFIVTNGRGTLNYKGNCHKLTTGNCVFIDCEQDYSHCSSEDALWTLKWVHFYSTNMGGIYRKYVERGGYPVFSSDKFDDFFNLLEELYSLAVTDDYIKDMRINEKLSSLLTMIMSESWHPENRIQVDMTKQHLQNIRDYINDNFKDHITLDLLSKKFYINKYYLSRAFKEQFGITINMHLMQVRISHAKELLRYSSLTLEQIGASVGIPEPSYFNHVFKKIEGTTPGAYRQHW